jgi:hypothetical protein
MARIVCTLFVISITASFANAQLLNKKGEEVRPYYISFDHSETNVVDVRGEFLNISYRDRIGTSETITFSIHDSKRQLIRELKFVKQFGQNYFYINLDDQGITLVETQSYVCRIKNENAEVSQRTIRYASKVKIDISASIIVKPKYLSCQDDNGSNLVEFYGEVNGGRAPYKANWYVLNARRTDFLYQPANVIVPSPGMTSSITVDQAPEYYVLLQVTDACGNEQLATVQVVCQKNEKKVNTLFFQKLDDAIIRKVETSK